MESTNTRESKSLGRKAATSAIFGGTAHSTTGLVRSAVYIEKMRTTKMIIHYDSGRSGSPDDT